MMVNNNRRTFVLGISLLLSAAGLAFATTATDGQARVTSSKALKTSALKRNVVPTGKTALYAKVGGKQVASKKTMAKLSKSKNSMTYFYAYRVAKTSKGQVYYKVVSFNGKYRGWVYGGKSTAKFAGGVKRATTTKAVGLTSKFKSETYEFKSPGTSNVTWTYPSGTQYSARKVVKSTKPYANDDLKVTKAAKKTREGTEYYKVTSKQHPKISGWIYAGAVKAKNSIQTLPSTPDVSTPTPEVTPEVSVTAGEFSLKNAAVFADENTTESNSSVITSVRDAYKKQIISSLPEPYKYSNTSEKALESTLGHGKKFTVNGKEYAVVVDSSRNGLVSLIPWLSLKWINPKIILDDLDNSLVSGLIDEKTMGQIQTAASLYYRLNYLGSLIILSPMSDSTVNKLLGGGKRLSIDIGKIDPSLPFKPEFKIDPVITRNDKGITGVNVHLKLDLESLRPPEPVNPVDTVLDSSAEGFPVVNAIITTVDLNPIVAGLAGELYKGVFQYYGKIDQSMNDAAVRNVLGHGLTLPIDEEYKAGFTTIKLKGEISINVNIEKNGSKKEKVTVSLKTTNLNTYVVD